MNQSAYNLYSFCDGYCIANDKCNTLEELKNTFIDAYLHYVGRNPAKNTIDKFMSKRSVKATNGYVYDFGY